MYVEELVEVAIGLVLAWLVLSVATTHIQEVIAGWLSLRADGLEDILESMLTGERQRMGPISRFWEQIIRRQRFSKLFTWLPRIINWLGNRLNPSISGFNERIGFSLIPAIKNDIRLQMGERSDLLSQLYKHPIIAGLSLGDNSKPSYIAAQDFTTALFQVVSTAGTDKSIVQNSFDSLEKNIESMVSDLMVKAGNELTNVLNLAWKEKNEGNGTGQYDHALQTLTKTYPLLKHLGDVLKDELNNHSTPTTSNENLCQKAIQILLDEERGSIEQVQDSQMWMKMNEFLRKYGRPYLEKLMQTDDKGDLTIDQLQENVARLAVSQPVLSESLYTILYQVRATTTEAENKIAAARTEVEHWFNSSMDRASGWYKRNRQWGAFAIAFFLAIIINVDTIHIGKRLWYEPALRQAIVAEADKYEYEANSDKPTEGNEDFSSLNDVQKDIQGFSNELVALGFPVGWQVEQVLLDDGETCNVIPNVPNEVGGIPWQGKCFQTKEVKGWGDFLMKLAGWGMTALATMQGAPFWFDILQKLVGFRGSGKTPDTRKQEEGVA